MNHLQNFQNFEYTKEEINLKKALIGGAMAGAIGYGAYQTSQINKFAKIEDTEVISGVKFNQYDVYVNDKTFSLNISEDGIISAEWSEKDGKNDKTYNCITIPDKTQKIWISSNMDMGNGIFVSGKPIPGSESISISDLDIYEQSETYIIYSYSMFSSVDYIIMNKGHKKGEDFEIENKIGKYICDELDSKIYIFAFNRLGDGSMGGAGSEGGWDNKP